MKKFNDGFLLGAATAAHQVEGNNINNDCWAMENVEHSTYVEPSGIACDHYNRYEEDIRLLAEAGLNAYRFSIEWARIEPKEGEFDQAEIQHYRDVIACCKKYGVEPVVTLFHFSSPAWLIAKGGWEADTVADDFARYVRCIMEQLGGELHYVCTINEANIRVQIANISKRYIKQAVKGVFTKKKKENDAEKNVQMGINIGAMLKNRKANAAECAAAFGVDDPKKLNNITFQTPCSKHGNELIGQAHMKAREIIKEMHPDIKVGWTLSLHDMQPVSGGEKTADKEWDSEFTQYLRYMQGDDFLGLQNYTRSLVGKHGWLSIPADSETTQAGYEYYPEALEHCIRRVAEDFKKEIIITENGIATDDDARRCDFIDTATDGVARCIADGIPVNGYFYWSLLDNFEWQKGFAMRFGLVAVDRGGDLSRSPKESLSFLGSMI